MGGNGIGRRVLLTIVLGFAMASAACAAPGTGQPESSGCPHATGNQGSTIDWVNFVRLHGIEYLAETAATLAASELGLVVASVHCRMEGNISDLGYQPKDGDAAFLDPGTSLYSVKGYKPSFRLAAWQEGRLTVFEADSNPAARVGGDLLDISGKVQYIGINNEQDGVTELGAVKNTDEVNALVAMVVDAPVNQQVTPPDGQRYFIAFHLDDGMTVVRAYWPAAGELSRGIALPQQFRQAVEQALRK